jgi:signal transduction histidine kinase
VERAAYRIVQEALTNVRRHAGEGARAEVDVGYRDEMLTVRVRNGGGIRTAPHEPTGPAAEGAAVDQALPHRAAAAEPAPAGAGISGMRERVVALGGRFSAAAHADGFEVYAELPTVETT